MKLLFILINLILSVANASETYENNPCYQKLISIDPATGQTFAETLYAPLVQKIHEDTNIPIDRIHQEFKKQYPNATLTEAIIDLSKGDFRRCYSPETILSKFKEQLKDRMNIDVTSDTIPGVRDELITQKFTPIHGKENSEATLFVGRAVPGTYETSNQQISYEQTAPNNTYFSIKPSNYTDTHSSGFTPDNFFQLTQDNFDYRNFDSFFDNASHNLRSKNYKLEDDIKEQTLQEIQKKYEGQPVAISTSDRIPFRILALGTTFLKLAEKENWDYSSLAKRNALRSRAFRQAATGNFDARDFCRNGQECGSVVIEEEPIHTAYHDYLRGKQKLTIVDLGSSVGFNSIRYALTNNHVILCDRSLGALIEAGNYMLQDHPDKAENLYLTTESADQLTLPENSVDVVFMGYLIKYFPGKDIDQMLKNIFNYLKPGGKLFLAEITHDNDFYKSHRVGPLSPDDINLPYMDRDRRAYALPFKEQSLDWPGEMGAVYDDQSGEPKFQYNLTKVTAADVINGLKRAGFRTEAELQTQKLDRHYIYNHMPAIQIIAVKPNE